jgi:hypothetical protein
MIYGDAPVKILLKIAMIVVVGAVAGNADVSGMLAPPLVLDFNTIAPHEAVIVKDRVAKLVNILHFKNFNKKLTWLPNDFDGIGIGIAYKELFKTTNANNYKTRAKRIMAVAEYNRGINKNALVTADLNAWQLVALSNGITAADNDDDIRGHIDLLLRCLGGNPIGTAVNVNGHNVTIQNKPEAVAVSEEIAKLVNVLHFKRIDRKIERHQTAGYVTNAETLSWLPDDFDGNGIGVVYKNLFNEAKPENYQNLANLITATEGYKVGDNKNDLVAEDLNTGQLVAISNGITAANDDDDIRGHINLLLRCLGGSPIGTAVVINGRNITIGDRLYASDFFQPKWDDTGTHHVPVEIITPNGKYRYFTITPTVHTQPVQFTANQVTPLQGEINIYFPADGSQPTTPEAVAWSCANVPDAGADDPITNWYMQMFGVIPFQNIGHPGADDYIEAGWNNAGNNPLPIIKLGDSMNIGTNAEEFRRAFRTIASNRVGRVLLYRMLIEIRRTTMVDHGIMQIPDFAVLTKWGGQAVGLLKKRWKLLNLIIQWDVKDACEINTINFNNNPRYYSAISSEPAAGEELTIVCCMQLAIPEQRLLHEFLHTFHKLRDFQRHDKEKSGYKRSDLANRDCHYGYFWQFDNNTPYQTIISSLPWSTRWPEDIEPLLATLPNLAQELEKSLAVEEIRTILGGVRNDSYLEGDDLSENLFLRSMNRPLRFGHEKLPFRENRGVLLQAVALTDIEAYGVPLPVWCHHEECIFPQDGEQIEGLGGFTISRSDYLKKLRKGSTKTEWNVDD